MRPMLKRNLNGALAQLLGFLGLLANNLIIPKLLGFDAFGRVATLLSMPYFVQGLVDSSLFAFVVHQFAFPRTRDARIRGLIPWVAVYFGGAGILMMAYGMTIGVSWPSLVLVLGIDFAIATYTILLSITLGAANSGALLKNSILFSSLLSILPFIFCLIIGKSPMAVLWAVFISYLLAAASLWRDARATLLEILGVKFRPGFLLVLAMAKKVGFLCGSRLLFVTFNTLALILFARHAEPRFVALYKLVLSADMALIYSVPLHPNIFQATLWHTRSVMRTAFLWVAGAWIVGGSVLLYILLPSLLSRLFKGQAFHLGALRLIPFLTPFLYIVWMTPTLLIGRVPMKQLFRISMFAVSIFLAVSFSAPYLMHPDQALVLAMALSLGTYTSILLAKANRRNWA